MLVIGITTCNANAEMSNGAMEMPLVPVEVFNLKLATHGLHFIVEAIVLLFEGC